MSTLEKAPHDKPPATSSYQTALCIIPSAHICDRIDNLRAMYDKAYGRWPPHINLIYPFVPIEDLPRAVDLIRSKLVDLGPESEYRNMCLNLDESDHFSHCHSNTIFIGPKDGGGGQALKGLRNAILNEFKNGKEGHEFHPHLTVGQSPTKAPPMREVLLDKARLLLPIEWRVGELVVLVRERASRVKNADSKMKIWGTIGFSENIGFAAGRPLVGLGKLKTEDASRRGITYMFSPANSKWEPASPSTSQTSNTKLHPSLKLSTYNVLHDDTIYPPPQERYTVLLRSILREPALADILILQEVSDAFLSYLLSQEAIRHQYPFSTQAPTNPLPSLCNIIVLSRFKFTWQLLPFEQRHKGAVILQFPAIGKYENGIFHPLVVAAVHLTSGLSDSAVAAKWSQLQTLFLYMGKRYSRNPLIVAGDFNITTSKFTIDEAIANKSISTETGRKIDEMENLFREVGLMDIWVAATAKTEKKTGGGEEGSTFDPLANSLAAGSATRVSYNMRPQRYDRILFKQEYFGGITEFNMFGFPGDEDPHARCGSDHWGIRATLRLDPERKGKQVSGIDIETSILDLKKAPPRLLDLGVLRSCLREHKMIPTDEETQKRKDILILLKHALQRNQLRGFGDGAGDDQHKASMVIVPVGSYGLGVWSPSSDIDILCIGCISPKIFISMASCRLKSAAGFGIKILRTVDAARGTMLELEVRDVRCDLQYCPAGQIVERWPEVAHLPATDPIFSLPITPLLKLNAFRDLLYLQQTIPNISTFGTAYRFIKAWAKQRGIYASRFGYLGGFHITLMLSQICKLLSHQLKGEISAVDTICTFFHHYANFDWSSGMVIDPDIHNTKSVYPRGPGEKMVILSLYPPRLNVCRAASLATLKTIVGELKRANDMLSKPDVTWSSLIAGTTNEGAQEFLKAYTSYVKINIQYWGESSEQGSSLLGWIESQSLHILLDLDRKLPQIHPRLWPARFTLPSPPPELSTEIASNTLERASAHQTIYLIGLSRSTPSEIETKPKTEAERKLAHAALRAVLEKFVMQIRGNKKYFDAQSTWVDADLVRRAEVGELLVVDR